jgi:SAM-dependent methyltransferase
MAGEWARAGGTPPDDASPSVGASPSSEDRSKAFYRALGADGLAARTRADWDAQIVASVLELLPPRARVLDAGCGYGRVAVPLAAAGHEVAGLDLSPELIAAARAAAAAQGVEVAFTVGSMTRLPYADGSFDAVICLWSAFHELLEEREQDAALGEFRRVLAPGGLGLVEGPLPVAGERISWDVVEGHSNPHYRHDAESFGRRARSAAIDDFEVFEREWGGRLRQLLRFTTNVR